MAAYWLLTHQPKNSNPGLPETMKQKHGMKLGVQSNLLLTNMTENDNPLDKEDQTLDEEKRRELEPEILEGDIVDEQGKSQGKVRIRTKTTITTHSGPLPHPDILKQYNEIVPGAAREILDMAKTGHMASIEHEKRIIEGTLELKKRGQRYALCVFGIAATLSLIMTLTGNATQGAAVMGIGLGSVAIAFITGKKKDAEDKNDEHTPEDKT